MTKKIVHPSYKGTHLVGEPVDNTLESYDLISYTYKKLSEGVDRGKTIKSEALLDIYNRIISMLLVSSPTDNSDTEKIRTKLTQFLSNPGRGARITFLNNLHNYLTNTTSSKELILSAIVLEGFHNLTLLVDDCLDGDLIRRGRKTIYAEFGKEGVCIASYILLSSIEQAIESLTSIDNQKKVYSIILDVSKKAQAAVINETQWEKSNTVVDWTNVTEGDIREIYIGKTSEIIALGIKVYALLSELPAVILDAMIENIEKVGILLQRANDIDNFSPLKDGLANPDRFSDLKTKRVTMLVLRQEISENAKLSELRRRVFDRKSTSSDVFNFASEIERNGIIYIESRSILNELNLIELDIRESEQLSTPIKNAFSLLIRSYLRTVINNTIVQTIH